jgi:hypothetical protein
MEWLPRSGLVLLLVIFIYYNSSTELLGRCSQAVFDRESGRDLIGFKGFWQD